VHDHGKFRSQNARDDYWVPSFYLNLAVPGSYDARLVSGEARGKRLGNPKLADARRHAAAARRERADRYSANVLPVIQEIQRSGIKSLRGVARALAARGIPTARGGSWTPVQVSAILERGRR
jgi:hypothetical protein